MNKNNNINTEKLEKLINIFIKDVGKEYFINLEKIYKILQQTLLNKKYVENLTEEKLDVFVDENRELLRYFEYFDFWELIDYAERLGNESNEMWRMKEAFKQKGSYIEDFKRLLIRFNIVWLKDAIQCVNKIAQEKGTTDIKSVLDDDDVPEIWHYLYYIEVPFLKNLFYPNYNDYNDILEFFDINDRYELSNNSTNFIDKVLQKNKNYNFILKNIPTGILFYHFCKWHPDEYIRKIQINNYHTIKNIELTNLNSKEIYLLGENGSGKTILLQSIFSAISANFYAKKFLTKEEKEKFTAKCSPFESSKSYEHKVYAYGVHRNRITTSREGVKKEYLTLFSNKAELNDPEEWLFQLNIKGIEDDNSSVLYFHDIRNLFHDLLDNISIDHDIPLLNYFYDDYSVDELDYDGVSYTDGIFFTENGIDKIEFHKLATGYQTVLIWVIDFIIRMLEKQPSATKLQDFTGTVLIDELDLFLHPKLAYKIMRNLRYWFPHVRFIISTHSPILILGASKDAIFYKVYKNEKGETQISEPYKNIDKLRLDQIITDEIFNLESSRSPHITRLLDERTEILSKPKLSKEDEKKLKEIDKKLGNLPVGESKYQRNAFSTIDKLAEILKNTEEK